MTYLYDTAYQFFYDWLFGGEASSYIIFQCSGDLLNFTITGETLVHILSVVIVGLFFYTAYWVVKWFINYIFSLGGGK